MCLTQGSLRQQQDCDTLRYPGLHARCTDAVNDFSILPERESSVRAVHAVCASLMYFLDPGAHQNVLTVGCNFCLLRPAYNYYI